MQREPVTLGLYLRERDNRTRNLRVRSWIDGLFGCQHKQMSRPFSRQGESYRVCLTCGAKRQFDEKTWKTHGSYYFSTAPAEDASPVKAKARKIGRRPRLVKNVA